MPRFETISLSEARSQTGRQREELQEYVTFIQQLGPKEAGKVVPVVGENRALVRRRLGGAARSIGTKIVIKRVGDEIYFWKKGGGGRRRLKPGPSVT